MNNKKNDSKQTDNREIENREINNSEINNREIERKVELCAETREYWDKLISDLDRLENNSTRRYRRHNISLNDVGERIVSMEKNQQQLLENERKAFGVLLDFMDNIENENLFKLLKKLKPIELKILIYRFNCKMKIGEIAIRLNRTENTISERLTRLVAKLKTKLVKKI